MISAPFFPRFEYRATNAGTNPSATPGTSVTPGASNSEGSWTQLLAGSNVEHDIYFWTLGVFAGATSAAQKDHLLDFGIDPAGGTSYTALFQDLVCGASAAMTAATSGYSFAFPLRIPAGASIAVRIQGNNATAGTVRVVFTGYGRPNRPEAFPVGMRAERVGTITNSQGVSFTPGNAADGSWVSLGTTSRSTFWWQLGYQVSNSTITAEYTYIDLAWGDATNKHIILRLMHAGTTSETCGAAGYVNENLNPFRAYCPVPAGANIYVRGRCSDAPDTGYNAVAIGIG